MVLQLTVGDAVGLDVGAADGVTVGILVGNEDGSGEGDGVVGGGVGDGDGGREGAAVVGDAVGVGDGGGEGAGDGSYDGNGVGDGDGGREGAAVVGDGVGLGVKQLNGVRSHGPVPLGQRLLHWNAFVSSSGEIRSQYIPVGRSHHDAGASPVIRFARRSTWTKAVKFGRRTSPLSWLSCRSR